MAHGGALDYLDFRRRLDSALTVDLIASPMPLAKADSIEVRAVQAQMESLGYDLLVVDEAVQEFWVLPRALPTLETGGTEPVRLRLRPSDLVASATPALNVVHLMVEHDRRFYFVLRGAEITGLVTYSDLDKRPVRTAVFALVNALEHALLLAVVRDAGERDEWQRYLSPKQTQRILAYWRNAKARDLDLNPIHYASLTDLVDIARAAPSMRMSLDQTLGSDWPEQMIDLRDFARDPVSHPGKPLVDSPAKVPSLWRACEFGERVLAVLTLDPASAPEPGGQVPEL